MTPTEVTHQLLREIRDGLGSRIDQTNARLDQTNARLDQTNAKLEHLEGRVVASELRVSTAITTLAGSVLEVKELLSDRLDLRDRVATCERDIAELRGRLDQP